MGGILNELLNEGEISGSENSARTMHHSDSLSSGSDSGFYHSRGSKSKCKNCDQNKDISSGSSDCNSEGKWKNKDQSSKENQSLPSYYFPTSSSAASSVSSTSNCSRCSKRDSGLETLKKSRGHLSGSIADEVSLQNEKEQNCCNNEIVVNNKLEKESTAKTKNQNEIQINLHSRKKNRDTSSRLRRHNSRASSVDRREIFEKYVQEGNEHSNNILPYSNDNPELSHGLPVSTSDKLIASGDGDNTTSLRPNFNVNISKTKNNLT